MTTKSLRSRVWAQHGVIARFQLLELGYTTAAIRHRIGTGRLHPVFAGVYAVGRPDLSADGMRMAAALSCGPAAFISHWSAGEHWGIRRSTGSIHVSVPGGRREVPDLVVHRRTGIAAVRLRNVPVTGVVDTLVDLALPLDTGPLESAVNNADKLELIDPETLRKAIGDIRRPGAAKLRKVLDRATFVYTESELERAFVPLAVKAGYGRPLTQKNIGAGRVDFYYDGIVVDADGLRYHRTAFTQTRDPRRDQAHKRMGVDTIRFSHAQIKYEKKYVVDTLMDVRPAALPGAAVRV
jgi:very-short-patch-repair endonuclease